MWNGSKPKSPKGLSIEPITISKSKKVCIEIKLDLVDLGTPSNLMM